MAYREPAPRPPPPPQSPDLDPALFRTPWWRPVLIVSFLWLPPWLILEWSGNLPLKVNGHTYPVTLTQQVVTSVIVALWFAALFVLRARHRRRERAVYLALQPPSENAHVRVALNDELQLRVPLERDDAEPDPEVEADSAKQRRIDVDR